MKIYDMLLANAMMGEGGGGGGGSSDFSTAEVTIINNTGDVFDYLIPVVIEEEGASLIVPSVYSEDGESFTVALYKGSAWGSVSQTGVTKSFTGDIVADGSGFIITGNGTITLS